MLRQQGVGVHRVYGDTRQLRTTPASSPDATEDRCPKSRGYSVTEVSDFQLTS